MKGDSEIWAKGDLGKNRKSGPEIVFAQVREDASVELEAMKECGRLRHCVAIGSGGCTAFSLLVRKPALLTIVDINPAQIFLIELKCAALKHAEYARARSAFEENGLPIYEELRHRISLAARSHFDPRKHNLTRGLIQCGILERKLRMAMRLFRLFIHPDKEIRSMLSHDDLSAQTVEFQKRWKSFRWSLVFRLGLHPLVLRLVYGNELIRKLPENYRPWLEACVNQTFLNFRAASNGYLWQTFLQCYPAGNEDALPPYLKRPNFAQIKESIGNINLHCADLLKWLTAQPSGSIDFFALSNILEITGTEYNMALLGEIDRTASHGAIVCLRSIFPRQNMLPPQAHLSLKYDRALSDRLCRMDRSLVCKQVYAFRQEK